MFNYITRNANKFQLGTEISWPELGFERPKFGPLRVIGLFLYLA
jgi:hypothetical protein